MNDNLRSALDSLGANRLRSILTVLGIVIGISTMTSVTSVLQGFSSQVNSTFEELGTSTVYISTNAGPSRGGAGGREQNTRPEMEVSYIEYLEEVEGVAAAVPSAAAMASVKTSDGTETTTRLTGTDCLWPEVSGRSVERGRFFTDYEVLSRSCVCVIGSTVRERMFGDSEVLGEDVRVGGRNLTVIGVLEESGEMMGQDRDNSVLVPWTVFELWEPLGRNLTLMVAVESPEIMDETMSGIENTMRQIRGLSLDEDDNFEMMTADDLKEGFSTVSFWMFAGLLGLSGISLFVGSVGIANIMLVSVAQRTGEIGLRMALGATRGRIMRQFLTESITLSLIGGILGIAAGAGLAQLMALLTDLPAGLSGTGLAAGVAVSTLAGTIAGLYPASRAAGLQPVTALSHSI